MDGKGISPQSISMIHLQLPLSDIPLRDSPIGGLEELYNDTLNGVNGREYGYLNSDSNFEKTIQRTGQTERPWCRQLMSISSQLWKKSSKNLTMPVKMVEEGEGSKNTAAIVVDPNNGEIYAMANYPTFDLNSKTLLQ